MKGVNNSHNKSGGYSTSFHTNGTSRDAAVTATYNGVGVDGLQFEQLDKTNTGQIERCIGLTC
jgi:hypothetical protein